MSASNYKCAFPECGQVATSVYSTRTGAVYGQCNAHTDPYIDPDRYVHAPPKVLLMLEGATATCEYCGDRIVLDVTEGGGDPSKFGCWDWGTRFPDDIGGFDYGCADSPDSDEDATGGHSPIWSTIEVPS